MRSRRRKNTKLLLVMLILGLSLGYALISKTLGIVGTSGIHSNVWIIHWENVQPNESSTVSAETPEIRDNATRVRYSVNLKLPGDFYEFDVDAKNDGTIAGTITEIKHDVHKVVEGDEDDTLPDYIKYSIVYKNTDIPPALGDILGGGDKQTYTIRIEYDKDADELPDEDFVIEADTEITYSQVDVRNKYRIDFDPNGGKVYPTYKYIDKGEPIGDMPIAKKVGNPFGGWYNPTTDGVRITSGYVPESDMTLIAKWEPAQPTFGTGQTVNAKFKQLAGNSNATYNTNDSNVTAIVRSTTAPAEGTTTEIVSAEDSVGEIYAWYDNGTIYWWSAGEEEYLNPDSSDMYRNFKNLQTIDTNYNTLLLTNMSGMFAGVTIPSLDISDFNTSSVTNMYATFSGASIENLNVSNIDTSAVKTMSTMFANSNIPTLDLSDFNTVNVTDMSTMFASSQATTIDLSSFDTRNVTTLSTMFAGSKVTNLDLSHFDVRKVTSFSTLFSGSATTNIDISGWDFASTNSISGLFSGVPNLETINLQNVNTSNITNMGGMFSGSAKIKSLDLSDFDVSNVTTFSLFGGNTALKSVDISGWKFESTQSLSNFFSAGLSGLESVNLKDVDTSNITDMSSMFAYTTSLKKLNLESFDTSNVTNMNNMFRNMSVVKTISVSDSFVVDNVTTSTNMFTLSPILTGGNGTPQSESHIDKEYAHYDYGKPDPGYFNRGDIDTFTVTFDPTPGTVSPLSITVYDGEKIGPLPVPERPGYAFDGWYEVPGVGLPITKDLVPNRDMTVHAKWVEIESKFIDGRSFNIKIKELAGDTIDTTTYSNSVATRDNAITAFQRTPIEPTSEHKQAANLVSTEDSEKPIYAWFDNGTIYWWTSANKAYTNEDAQYMFAFLNNLTDIDTSFDTSITENFYYMFGDCQSLLEIDVSDWNTGNGRNMSFMFYTGSGMKKIDLSNFNTSKVTDMYSMIGYMEQLEEVNLSNFDFTNYNPGYDLMNKVDSYNRSIKKIIMENVILPQNCYRAFSYESHFIEIDLRNADTSNVTDMHYMFYDDTNLEKVDMTGWDTSKVTDMQNMFGECNKLKDIIGIEDFDTRSVTKMETMFYRCSALEELDLSKWDTSKVTNMYYLFYDNDNLKTLNLSNWDFSSYDTSKKMYNTWYDLDNLETLILDNAKFPTGSMELAFYGLRSVKNFSLKNVDTSNVIIMSYMFENNESIEVLDLSSFDTSNVLDMRYMFSWCYNLKTIIVSDKFVMTHPAFQSPSYSEKMFHESNKIVGGQGTTWDANYIDKTYAHIDGGENDPGYFTSSSAVNYKITLNANSGNVSAPETYVKQGEAIGNIPTPTRKGYTFTGWYTSLNDGVKVDSTFVPEEDMTLYAIWRDSQVYRITFNSNGGTSTQYKRTILKGDPIGELPKAEKENYIFKGWYTGLFDGTRVTKDTTPTGSIALYARFTRKAEPESFATDTWETIIAAAKNNTACNAYHIGDEREIDMGEYGKHTLRVANCSKPAVCNDSNFSQTACGFVIEFKDIIALDIVNPYEVDVTYSIKGNGSIGGWEYSHIRQVINNDIYNSLPEIVKNNIATTKVISGHSSYETENYTTNDKLYLLSPLEIYKDYYRDDDIADQTRQLDFYADRSNSIYSQSDIHSLKNYNGHAQSWWTREPFSYRDFVQVSTYGSESWDWTSYTSGISPAFKFN